MATTTVLHDPRGHVYGTCMVYQIHQYVCFKLYTRWMLCIIANKIMLKKHEVMLSADAATNFSNMRLVYVFYRKKCTFWACIMLQNVIHTCNAFVYMTIYYILHIYILLYCTVSSKWIHARVVFSVYLNIMYTLVSMCCLI